MDKRDGVELARFVEELPGAGEWIPDLEGPAYYHVTAPWATAIVCTTCRYIGLVTSLPARSLTWPCPRCGRRHRLRPPVSVVLAPRATVGAAGRLS